MIWGSRESERLLRRWIASQIMFALSGALLVAYLLWGRDDKDPSTDGNGRIPMPIPAYPIHEAEQRENW